MNLDEKIKFLKEKSGNLWEAEKYKESLKTSEEIFSIYESQDDRENMLKISIRIGFRFDLIGDFDAAESYYNSCLNYSKELQDDEQEAHALHNIGGIHLKRGDLDGALDYFEKSLKIRNSIKEQRHIAYSLHNIGRVHFQKKNYETALEYFKEALEIRQNIIAEREVPNEYDYYDLAQSIFDLGILSLETDGMNSYQDYVSLLDQIKVDENAPPWNRIFVYRKILQALLLKEDERLEYKFRSVGIFREVKDKTRVQKLRAFVIKHLLELLVLEFQTTRSKQVFQEISELIEELIKISERQKSYLLNSESLILQSQISLIEGDVEQAHECLENAEQIAVDYGLQIVKEQVDAQKNRIKKELTKWQSLSEENIDFIKQLEKAGIKEYIRYIQKRGLLEVDE